MKEKIEEYIKALIEHQESRMRHQVFQLVMSIVLANIFITMLLIMSLWFIIPLLMIICFVSITGTRRLERELMEKEDELHKLHPIDGEQGAVKTATSHLADFLEGLFGKKFIGVKKFNPNQDEDE